MKKFFYISLFIIPVFHLQGQQNNEHEVLTRQFITYLENNQFYDAEDMFGTQVRQMLSLEQMQDLWASMIRKLGAYREVEEVLIEDTGGTVITRARTNFSSAPIIIQLAFNREKKITGIYFKPVVTEANYTLPAYANVDLYIEEDVFLEVPQGQLPATFTRPSFLTKYPVVVLIHGSGPHDRDETIGPNKPFKDLAIGLATQGIATFRYDKKTKVYPEYFEEIRSNMTVEDEILQDAATAIDYAKKIKGVNRREIYILGHSLGGMLAPRIADENREVDGIIIMGGNARPLEDLILHQVEYLSSLDQVPENEKQSLAALREQAQQLKTMDKTIGTPPRDLPLGLPVGYWSDLSAYDQLSVAEELKEPILVLQAGRDYQVPVEEFERWKAALGSKKNVTFRLYPTLNHLFIPGEGRSTPQEYNFAGHIPEIVIREIAEWIKFKK